MASIGQSITGPRFVEMDEVLRNAIRDLCFPQLTDIRRSGLIGKKHTLTFLSHSFVASLKPSILSPGSAMVRFLPTPHGSAY